MRPSTHTAAAPVPEQTPQQRRVALIAGVLFLVTFLTSIPALFFYEPLLDHAGYVLGAGSDGRVEFGAFLEVLLAVANIGTAVVLYPIVKRQNESVALGYVASRILESTVIVIGIVSVLSVVALRQDLAGAAGSDPATLTAVGRSLVALHDQTFLLGPAFCAGIGNGILLGYLLYRSGLVPRGLALLGLVGGPLAFATATAVLLGAYEQGSAINGLFTAPEALFELSLGVYLAVRGFRPSPILGEAGPAAVWAQSSQASNGSVAPAAASAPTSGVGTRGIGVTVS